MKAHRVTSGFRGIIPDIETYEKLKRDEVGWEPHVEAQMAEVILPYELFMYLMALNKEANRDILSSLKGAEEKWT